ncbi:MAG: 4Fe-4S binding protein, partial [Thermoleophilia bacterium]|nr:4Fe-4S binding protein [Thermoleophilia bacterium]
EPGTRAVRVNAELCIGCHSCSIACPFGVPRFGQEGTMQKCDLCTVRLENGLEPACVRVCPTKALRQGDPNELGLAVEQKAAERLAAGS